MKSRRTQWLALILIAFSSLSSAIDNPDSPDFFAEFQAREKPFITATENPKNSYRDTLLAFTSYLNFLNEELNDSYQMVLEKLPEKQKKPLMESQEIWLQHKEKEFSFIENTWNKTDFGSSSNISRGQFKAGIIRQRIINLMAYERSLY